MVRFLDKNQISTIASDDIMPITDISESTNDKKISIGQLTTYFSQNLSNFALKDLSNTNMLTDAILLAPNGVIVATNSNVDIVAKSGMVLLFADGRNADGTLKSLQYTLSEDKTQTIATLSDGDYVMFLTNVGALAYVLQKDVYISRIQPTVTSTTSYWYDIKNNLWKKTVDTGSTWTNVYLNSLGLFTITSGVVTEIIPNTVAYIPNPEVLMLKDASNITEEGKERLRSYVDIDSKANISLSNLNSTGQAIIDNKANLSLSNINSTGQALFDAKADLSLSNVTSDAFNNVLGTINATDKSNMIGWGAPDYTHGVNKSIDTDYTASENGWLYGYYYTTYSNNESYFTIDGVRINITKDYDPDTTRSSGGGGMVMVAKGSVYRGTMFSEFKFFPCKG